MAEWQPIETAPEDEFVLVMEPSGRCGGAYLLGGEWSNDEGDAYNPTHWMHLPTPPQETEE